MSEFKEFLYDLLLIITVNAIGLLIMFTFLPAFPSYIYYIWTFVCAVFVPKIASKFMVDKPRYKWYNKKSKGDSRR